MVNPETTTPPARLGYPAARRGLFSWLIDRFEHISLKNKIYFSTTAVILLISVLIALFTRWILISSLTSELKLRGVGIAQSVAESSRSDILTADAASLTGRLFDVRLGERKALVSYVFVLDKRGRILAHTFTRPFPVDLAAANPIAEEAANSIRLLRNGSQQIYDVAVPVTEGIYWIGSVHLGIDKRHIDQLIGKLRTTFVGFVSVVTVIFFIISNFLARYITRPISELTRLSDAISRGSFDVAQPRSRHLHCWQIRSCKSRQCPAPATPDVPCWHLDGTPDETGRARPFTEKIDTCRTCGVYRRGMRDELGNLASSFIHMTYRIRISQERLHQSEEKYRSLFDSGPNPIFVIDRYSLKILDANPSAEKTYGYPRAKLVGRLFPELGALEIETDLRKVAGMAGLRQTMVVSSKVRFLRSGQIPFYVNVHACPVAYTEREALIVATTDITEMVEKDNQLIQVSKMKTLGEVSAGIAHELNQPLNAIKMGADFLAMMVEGGQSIAQADLHQVGDEISRQVDRAADIVQRLRDFGRKSDFGREQISLNQPIQSVLGMLGRQLNLQNIRIELELDADPPLILAQHNRLQQVVFNLVTNARDAINQKPELDGESGDRWIRIRTWHDRDKASIEVCDNGIGIPKEDQERIFEAFFTTKEMGEGMGLGLSISSGIVQDYHGRMRVESMEGTGTCFHITFPVVADRPHQAFDDASVDLQ